MRVAVLSLALPLVQAIPQASLLSRGHQTRDIKGPARNPDDGPLPNREWDGPKPIRAWNGPAPNPADDGPEPNPADDGPEPNPADDGPEPNPADDGPESNPARDGPREGRKSNQIKANEQPPRKPEPQAQPGQQPSPQPQQQANSGPMNYDDMILALLRMGMDPDQRSEIEKLLQSSSKDSTFELSTDTPPEADDAQDSGNPKPPPTVNIQQKPKEQKAPVPADKPLPQPKVNQELPKPKQQAPPPAQPISAKKPATPKPASPKPATPPTSDKPTSGNSVSQDVKDMAVEKHNSYRSKHQAGPLEWDQGLADEAWNWINRSDKCILGHPSDKDYGQNLYLSRRSNDFTDSSVFDDVSASIDSWYNEIRLHDFSRNYFVKETGHFTQLVWKSTERVGCATRLCEGENGEWNSMVTGCNYFPAGNMQGAFIENVSR
ncbi:hypothetical protein CDD81_699 [Ophiocordyceps australis]|uniref:SCP domain-containing protein n=1 Tax=Ophiocordyceps australis TaxID=1399860 RepID=A0A2C5Y0H7_9HYPO|nr:hypothetical protein CDD81_699 [Ophiocordyceps australis]